MGRIWADGKLLRGAGGDFKVGTQFRFYDGSANQLVDPLIASIEGIDLTPAYRGLAVAVFEGLELAEYGNRIPFLTFELIGDEQPPTIGEILSDASGGAVDLVSVDRVAGYAAYGTNVRSSIRPLVEAHGIDLFDDGTRIRTAASEAVETVTDDQLGNRSDREEAPRFEREMAPARSLPAAIRLSYYDPDRDFQSGEARASAGEQPGGEERRELAAVMTADVAKGLAHQMMARRWAERERLTLRLPPSFLWLEPGGRLELPTSPLLWTADKVMVEGFVVIAELKPAGQQSPLIVADPGRILPSRDVVAQPATLAMVEIPADSDGDSSASPATLMLAASSPSPEWRSAAVTVTAGGRSFALATPRRKSILGIAENALGASQPYLLDEIGQVTVALIDQDQWLESRDLESLAAGANLAMIGNEVIQFATVLPLGGGRFALSRLLRGRGGSEWAMAAHVAGETFVLLDPARLARVDLPASLVGATATARLDGRGGQAVSNAVAIGGEKSRPPAPVELAAATAANGDLLLSWVRRSRDGFSWVDEVDAPLGETSERYSVIVTGTAASAQFDSAAPQLTVPATTLASLGSGAATVAVRQIGDRAMSRPAMLAIAL